MANEISVSFNLSASKGGAALNASISNVADMAGDQMISNVQIIGTSNEALLVGDVATPGLHFIRNLDETNYVEIFQDNGNANRIAKLLPGEFCLISPEAAVYARANTAACNVQSILLER